MRAANTASVGAACQESTSAAGGGGGGGGGGKGIYGGMPKDVR